MTKRTTTVLTLLLSAPAIGRAQTLVDLHTQSKSVDFSGAPTRTTQTGSLLPSTCSVGQSFFKSDNPPGQNLYGCTAPNFWTLLTSGDLSSQDLILGNRSVIAGKVVTGSAGEPTRLDMTKGSCPAAADAGYDSTLCVDADGKTKVVRSDGSLDVLGAGTFTPGWGVWFPFGASAYNTGGNTTRSGPVYYVVSIADTLPLAFVTFETSAAVVGHAAVAWYDTNCNLIANSVSSVTSTNSIIVIMTYSSPLNLNKGTYFLALSADVAVNPLTIDGVTSYALGSLANPRVYTGTNAAAWNAGTVAFPAVCGDKTAQNGAGYYVPVFILGS